MASLINPNNPAARRLKDEQARLKAQIARAKQVPNFNASAGINAGLSAAKNSPRDQPNARLDLPEVKPNVGEPRFGGENPDFVDNRPARPIQNTETGRMETSLGNEAARNQQNIEDIQRNRQGPGFEAPESNVRQPTTFEISEGGNLLDEQGLRQDPVKKSMTLDPETNRAIPTEEFNAKKRAEFADAIKLQVLNAGGATHDKTGRILNKLGQVVGQVTSAVMNGEAAFQVGRAGAANVEAAQAGAVEGTRERADLDAAIARDDADLDARVNGNQTLNDADRTVPPQADVPPAAPDADPASTAPDPNDPPEVKQAKADKNILMQQFDRAKEFFTRKTPDGKPPVKPETLKGKSYKVVARLLGPIAVGALGQDVIRSLMSGTFIDDSINVATSIPTDLFDLAGNLVTDPKGTSAEIGKSLVNEAANAPRNITGLLGGVNEITSQFSVDKFGNDQGFGLNPFEIPDSGIPEVDPNNPRRNQGLASLASRENDVFDIAGNAVGPERDVFAADPNRGRVTFVDEGGQTPQQTTLSNAVGGSGAAAQQTGGSGTGGSNGTINGQPIQQASPQRGPNTINGVNIDELPNEQRDINESRGLRAANDEIIGRPQRRTRRSDGKILEPNEFGVRPQFSSNPVANFGGAVSLAKSNKAQAEFDQDERAIAATENVASARARGLSSAASINNDAKEAESIYGQLGSDDKRVQDLGRDRAVNKLLSGLNNGTVDYNNPTTQIAQQLIADELFKADNTGLFRGLYNSIAPEFFGGNGKQLSAFLSGENAINTQNIGMTAFINQDGRVIIRSTDPQTNATTGIDLGKDFSPHVMSFFKEKLQKVTTQ